MAEFRSIICILLALLLLCACGSAKEEDGIDSVTYISDIASAPPHVEPEAEDKNRPVFSGMTLAELDGTEFSSSIYILFMNEALENVMAKYEVAPENVQELEVLLEDGTVINAKEFCETYAKNEFKWVCLLAADYKNCGGELKECSHYQEAASKANAAYSEDTSMYTALGVSLSDLILYYLYTDLYYDDFVLQYSPGGKKAISENELSMLMENNTRKISYTFLPFYDEKTNRDFTADEKSAFLKLSEEYLKRFKSGEDFSEIVKENYMLLDSYHLSFDPSGPIIYYSPADPMLPSLIAERAERLKDNEAALVKDDDFVSVVLRLPVNETKDEKWMAYAMELAFQSRYGDMFSEEMSTEYDDLDLKYNEDILSQLTLEGLISARYAAK
ncbi:MAG: hypothetical protein K5771_00045 [Oscillospiraceae bacterium]|nr:hypothetical protein [Oscillospiraceae bacterium]